MNRLSKLTKANLTFFQIYKDKNPTIIGMFQYNARLYLYVLLLFSIVIFIEYLFAGWWVAGLFIAFILGAFCREVGVYRIRIRLWPMMREIIDWNKVASKLEKFDQESSEKNVGKP